MCNEYKLIIIGTIIKTSLTTRAGVSPRFKRRLFISNVFVGNIKLHRLQQFVHEPLVKWACSSPGSLVAINKTSVFSFTVRNFQPIQLPLGLRRGSAATRLLIAVSIAPCRGYLSLVSAVYCQVEVPATRRSLVQKSLTECGV
jgi:hypothetical protein